MSKRGISKGFLYRSHEQLHHTSFRDDDGSVAITQDATASFALEMMLPFTSCPAPASKVSGSWFPCAQTSQGPKEGADRLV